MPVAYLYPDGVNSNDSWTAHGAGTLNDCMDDPQSAPDDDTTYGDASASVADRALSLTMGAMVDMVSASSVDFVCRVRDNSGGGAHVTWQLFVIIGGTRYNLGATFVSTGSYANTTRTQATNPATSQPWTQADLNACIFGIEHKINATSTGRCTQLYMAVTYTPISGDISTIRLFASRYLLLFRRLIPMFVTPAPLTLLDLELGDDFSVVHPAGPHPQGLGWRYSPKSERGGPFRLRGTILDLNTMTVTPTADDRHDYLTTLWETFEAIRTSLAEDGNARVSAGGAFTYARTTDAWGEDPGSLLVTRFGSGIKMLVDQGSTATPNRGLLIEDASTNYLHHSSFVSGASTGWTRTGLGGTATLDATISDPLFDSATGAQVVKLVRGATADNVYTSDASDSITNGTTFRVSIDHRDTAGDPLVYRIQRAVDNFFWRDSDQTWQAGATDNTLAVSTTRVRDVTKPIAIGGTTTTVTVQLRQMTASGDTNWIYHVEAKSGYAITSRVITTTAGATRALATYKYAHSSTKRGLLVTGGTWQGYWTPFFSSSDNASGTVTIWEIVFDANNLFRLQWNAAAGQFEFVIKQGGTTTTATKSATLTRGTEVYLAVRWTSTLAELGLAARTQSVFVAGVKGTDATRAGDPTEATADLYLGGSSTVGANGKLRRWRFRQVVLRDEEIARGTP